MSTSPFPDPFQLWRDALSKLEGQVNSLVTGTMDSHEVMRSVHQLSTLSLGLQQAFEKAIGAYFAKVNLPSRKDVTELAAAVQRVEDKLDRLLPAAAETATAPPRPARTRRPPVAAAAVAAVATPAGKAAPAPAPPPAAKPTRRAAPGKAAARKRGRS
jgi:hypothetical protein